MTVQIIIDLLNEIGEPLTTQTRTDLATEGISRVPTNRSNSKFVVGVSFHDGHEATKHAATE